MSVSSFPFSAEIAVLLLAIAAVILLWRQRRVQRDLRRAEAILTRLARGDFDARLVGVGRGPIAPLLHAANEVKELARRTATATEEIVAHVGSIQDATGRAVESLRDITGKVGEVEQAMLVVASAVEQQGVATREIARNVEEASAGTAGVSMRIVQVTGAAAETGAASARVLTAANDLTGQSTRLGNEIGSFLDELRKVV